MDLIQLINTFKKSTYILYIMFVPALYVLAYTSSNLLVSFIIVVLMMLFFIKELFNKNKLLLIMSILYLALGLWYIDFYIIGSVKDKHCVEVVRSKFSPETPMDGMKMQMYVDCRKEFNILKHILSESQ